MATRSLGEELITDNPIEGDILSQHSGALGTVYKHRLRDGRNVVTKTILQEGTWNTKIFDREVKFGIRAARHGLGPKIYRVGRVEERSQREEHGSFVQHIGYFFITMQDVGNTFEEEGATPHLIVQILERYRELLLIGIDHRDVHTKNITINRPDPKKPDEIEVYFIDYGNVDGPLPYIVHKSSPDYSETEDAKYQRDRKKYVKGIDIRAKCESRLRYWATENFEDPETYIKMPKVQEFLETLPRKAHQDAESASVLGDA